MTDRGESLWEELSLCRVSSEGSVVSWSPSLPPSSPSSSFPSSSFFSFLNLRCEIKNLERVRR